MLGHLLYLENSDEMCLPEHLVCSDVPPFVLKRLTARVKQLKSCPGFVLNFVMPKTFKGSIPKPQDLVLGNSNMRNQC